MSEALGKFRVYRRLRFPPIRHPRRKHWIGSITDSRIFPSNRNGAAGLLGLAHLALMAGVATMGGFLDTHIQSVPMYVTAFFTFWMFAFGSYSDSATAELPRRIRPAFDVPADDDLGASEFHSWLYAPAVTLAPGGILAGGLAAAAVAWPELWDHWLATEYDDNSWGIALVATNLIILAVLGYSMIWGFCAYVFYTYWTCRHPAIASLAAARTFLRPITTFGLVTGLGWSAAVIALVAFFHRDLNGFALGTIAVLGAMAVALILLPQLLAHLCLEETQQAILREASMALRKASPAVPAHYFNRLFTTAPHAAEVAALESFIDRVSAVKTWIYEPRDVVLLGAEILVPAITLYVAAP